MLIRIFPERVDGYRLYWAQSIALGLGPIGYMDRSLRPKFQAARRVWGAKADIFRYFSKRGEKKKNVRFGGLSKGVKKKKKNVRFGAG